MIWSFYELAFSEIWSQKSTVFCVPVRKSVFNSLQLIEYLYQLIRVIRDFILIILTKSRCRRIHNTDRTTSPNASRRWDEFLKPNHLESLGKHMLLTTCMLYVDLIALRVMRVFVLSRYLVLSEKFASLYGTCCARKLNAHVH